MNFMCFDIINSQWYITHEPFRDPLLEGRWLADFMKKWGLEGSISSEEDFLNQLLKLRSFLTEAACEIVSGSLLTSQQIETINHYLAQSLLYNTVLLDSGSFTVSQKPAQPDSAYILSRIVHSFAVLISSYDIKRIKLCGNEACRWIFYDESKNATRRWCDSTCGSLMKVRRFRSKKKANPE